MSRIFISYRRSDSISEAGRIYDYLENHFGRDAIFKDVDDIDAGDDFRESINDAVGQCQILLAVIGQSWLTVTDATGKRRLDNPADWVHLEIATALQRQIRVVPVLLDGVEMPAVYDLPEALQPLAHRNAARVRHDPDFRRDMQRVTGVVTRHFASLGKTGVASVSSTPDPAVAKGQAVAPSKMAATPKLPAFGFEVTTIDRVEKNGRVKTTSRRSQANYHRADLGNGVTLDLVAIPGGTFTMGSSVSELQRLAREGPQHAVTVASFLLGKYPVTQAQWRAVAAMPKVQRRLEADPSAFKGDRRPVECVSREDATEFCQRLSKHTGQDYRLPSEAEWEYACRAGTETPFHFGETLTADLANYAAKYTYGKGPKGQYRGETTEVGAFPANAFGLYDMHGNVWEWCQDCWHENYEGAPGDGNAWVANCIRDSRILRGGSWSYYPWYCRSASRVCDFTPVDAFSYFGFRVSCSAPRIS